MTGHDSTDGPTRRTFLHTAIGAAALGGVARTVSGAQQEPQLIVLGGRTPGWRGRAPASIQGETNPTLPLVAGQDYRVRWTNVDGQPHNFVILGEGGEDVVASDIISTEGATQRVTFTASENMAEYYCEVHPTTMRGDVEIVEERQLEPVDETRTTTEVEAEPAGEGNDTEPLGADVAQPIGLGDETIANNTTQLQQFRRSRQQRFDSTGNGTLRGNLTYTNETANATQTTQAEAVSASDVRQAARIPGFGVLAALGSLVGGSALLSRRSED